METLILWLFFAGVAILIYPSVKEKDVKEVLKIIGFFGIALVVLKGFEQPLVFILRNMTASGSQWVTGLKQFLVATVVFGLWMYVGKRWLNPSTTTQKVFYFFTCALLIVTTFPIIVEPGWGGAYQKNYIYAYRYDNQQL